MGKKDNLRKNIYYIGFYSFSGGTLEKENRVYSSAAVNLMNFISQKLSSNATVNIISPSWTNNQRGIYRGKKVQLSDNVFLNIAPSVGTYFGLGKFLSIIISQIWLIFKIIFTIKERDKVIVYHSVAFAPVILITKKLFSYKLILQLNEVYQDVKSQGLIKNYFEKAIIRDAGAYIVSNHFLKERMTYLTNNLIVLSLSNSLILSSPVSNLIFTYEKNDPSQIAEVIANIDYKKNHSGEYTNILDSIEVNFNNELLLLVA